LAVLIAAVSLVGVLAPSIYARETPSWAGQAIGQDWVDLVVAAPVLFATAVLALRGSRRAQVVLAGALAYAAYTFAIYGFAVRVNPLFLAYCAALGISLFALAGACASFICTDVRRWYGPRTPVRTVGALLIAIGAVFLGLWLAELIPALAAGVAPRSVADAGLLTNPVHVLDLSIVLPAHITAGIALLRRHPLGYAFAGVLLAFGALMAASIAGMMLVMHWRGLPIEPVVAGAMAAVAVVSAVALGLLLRRLDVAGAS
jgi:hypothetical protein